MQKLVPSFFLLAGKRITISKNQAPIADITSFAEFLFCYLISDLKVDSVQLSCVIYTPCM